MFLDLVTVTAGIILLIRGADWLVEGGSKLARQFGISHLVIGLTIVSFGTSAPELIVNLIASFGNSPGISIGNIIGSNIANTLLIIGSASIITPLNVRKSTVFKEIPFCMLAAVTLLIAANDSFLDGYVGSAIHRTDGLIFLGFFLIFLYYTFGIRHHRRDANHEKHHMNKKVAWLSTGMVVIGCLGLSIGGHLTVSGAQNIARILGVGEALIGLTIIAIGTSLPELVTSITAALKNNADIAVGNVVGSNIFNIFWILGISATIKPIAFDTSLNLDVVLVAISTLLLFLFVHTGKIQGNRFLQWLNHNKDPNGHILGRIEGLLLLFIYGLYILYISMRG